MSATSDRNLTSAYGQLFDLLVSSPAVDTFLNQVVRLATDVVPAAAAGGITVHRDGHLVTVASSDPFAARVDEIQYGADEGPCLDALRSGEVVQVDDLAGESRWESYRPHALAEGVASSLSLPLTVDGRTIGALNLYARRPDAFVPPARTHAEAFAGQCAAALTVTLRQADQSELQRQLAEAMASRSVIDQALGVLMGQQRCTASAAFDLLRQASQRRNRKLRDVAAAVITNVTGRPPEPPTDFEVLPAAD